MTQLSLTQFKVLSLAASRERGNVCPTTNIHAASQKTVLRALEKKGLIYWDNYAPRINEAGRAAIAERNS